MKAFTKVQSEINHRKQPKIREELHMDKIFAKYKFQRRFAKHFEKDNKFYTAYFTEEPDQILCEIVSDTYERIIIPTIGLTEEEICKQVENTICDVLNIW